MVTRKKGQSFIIFVAGMGSVQNLINLILLNCLLSFGWMYAVALRFYSANFESELNISKLGKVNHTKLTQKFN